MAAASVPAGRVDPSNRLHVRNLDYSVDDEALLAAFAQVASVTKATVVQWRYSGRSRGFGFIELATVSDAQNAADSLNGTDLNGRNIVVEFARSKGPRTAEEFREERGERTPQTPPEAATRLYVTNLTEGTNDEDLTDFFGAYGTVAEVRLIAARESRPGFAFIAFEDHEVADKALQETQGSVLDGNELTVEWARAPHRPRAGRRTRRPRGAAAGDTTESSATAGAPADGAAAGRTRKPRTRKPKGAAPVDGVTPGGPVAATPAAPRPQNRVYVANLLIETTEDDVNAYFGAYFPQNVTMGVSEARKDTDTDRYYAFVELADEATATKAVAALDGGAIGAATVRVELARSKGGKGRGGATRGRRRRTRGASGAAGAPVV